MVTLMAHRYTADPAIPADARGRRPCTCHLPLANAVHDPKKLEVFAEGQAAARRWAGDNDREED